MHKQCFAYGKLHLCHVSNKWFYYILCYFFTYNMYLKNTPCTLRVPTFGFEASASYWHFVEVVWLFFSPTQYAPSSTSPFDLTTSLAPPKLFFEKCSLVVWKGYHGNFLQQCYFLNKTATFYKNTCLRWQDLNLLKSFLTERLGLKRKLCTNFNFNPFSGSWDFVISKTIVLAFI